MYVCIYITNTPGLVGRVKKLTVEIGQKDMKQLGLVGPPCCFDPIFILHAG